MLKRVEAIINSMTNQEARGPQRDRREAARKRICERAADSVQEVNQVLKQYMQMRQMMKQYGAIGGAGEDEGAGKLADWDESSSELTRYLFPEKYTVGDLGGEGFGIEVGAIAEDDYGEAVGGETLDVGVEADGVAVVPHADVVAIGVQEPAEAVGDGGAFGTVGVGGPLGLGAIGELRGSQRGQHLFFA